MARPIAAITGASSGIGAVFARRLAATHDLLLIARRADRLESLATELRQGRHASVEVQSMDLTDERQLGVLADRIAAEPRLSLLINNAGFGTRGRFTEAAIEVQVQMHRLNILAVLRLTQAGLQSMVPRRSGAIINVASVAGFVRRAGSVGYGSTKAWVIAFTEALHLEMRAMGCPVKVQALCPGFTYTEFHDAMNIDRARIAGKPFWLSADTVVDASLRALARDRLFVVPGWRYNLVVNSFAILPLSIKLLIESFASRRH